MSTAWPVTPLPEGCVEVVLVPPVRRQQATGLAGQGQRKAQQGGVDLLRALEGFEVDGEVDEGVILKRSLGVGQEGRRQVDCGLRERGEQKAKHDAHENF